MRQIACALSILLYLTSCDASHYSTQREDLLPPIPVLSEAGPDLDSQFAFRALGSLLIADVGEETYWFRYAWSVSAEAPRLTWVTVHRAKGRASSELSNAATSERGRSFSPIFRKELEPGFVHKVELRVATRKPGEKAGCVAKPLTCPLFHTFTIDLRFP